MSGRLGDISVHTDMLWGRGGPGVVPVRVGDDGTGAGSPQYGFRTQCVPGLSRGSHKAPPLVLPQSQKDTEAPRG